MATSNNPANKPALNSAYYSNLRVQISQLLASKPYLSAKQVADALGEDRDRVFRQCERLQKEGSLQRDRSFYYRQYCVTCKTVVTADNYATCKDHDLREFPNPVWEWALMPQATVQPPQPKLMN